ncbi:MAG: pyridoxamine 5'-phosphate oxidase family protein [Acidimicrobiales bacterium]
MQLDAEACWERMRAARHGTFGTVHAERGVDLVPVVFVVLDDRIVIPIDTVKPKAGPRLQRLRNLLVDARAVLLVEHYDDDWSQLWWVRAHGSAREHGPSRAGLDALATAFPVYRDPGTVTSVIVLEPTEVAGWTATTPLE